ncbi:restriction endonuclease subunit S [Zunongwangia pacifica]|uniref:Restriction endonuclease subunit S n=1 Tax=Zunongwangia pacifica TaxID=2911062 RepID=A0A9X2A121_9FLAO|nr:restriction endonuclease subunit S [Zunongwangia pacifica]MCL6220106.1 restriction endonuclease subunit S [Zunongwangia pacifica]
MKDSNYFQLKEVANIINGGTPKTKIKDYWDGNIFWITPKDLGKLNEVFVSDTPRKITSLGLAKSSAKLIKPNSVILSTRAPIGHLAINKVEMTTNQGCRGIEPNEELDVKYLFYFLKSSVSLLNELGKGTTFKELSTKSLGSVEIRVPFLEEQQQIVQILDKAFAKIDQAIANLTQNIQNAEDLFQSKLNQIFNQQGKGWEEKKLGEVCENLDRKRVPISKNKREAGEIPYYGASGVVDYVKDYLFDEELLLVSEDGANLLARTYPIAFSISGKTWVNNHAHVLRFQDQIDQKFIELYLNSISLEPYVSGMAQPKLNQKKLNSIIVPDISKKEKKIVVENILLLKENQTLLIKKY